MKLEDVEIFRTGLHKIFPGMTVKITTNEGATDLEVYSDGKAVGGLVDDTNGYGTYLIEYETEGWYIDKYTIDQHFKVAMRSLFIKLVSRLIDEIATLQW